MEPSNEASNQFIWVDDEERRAILHSIFAADSENRRIENLADLLVTLREEMAEPAAAHKVAVEIDNLIELLFLRSEAYALALELYGGRYEIKGGGTPAEILRGVIAEKIDKQGQTAGADGEDEARPVSQPVRAKPQPEPEASKPTPHASDLRRDNVMRLGEHLAAILENPETPVKLHDDIADMLNDLTNESSPGFADDARLHWDRIAEMLLAEPRREAKP